MLYYSIIRTLKLAIQGSIRNVWLSVVTVFILVLTLLSISLVSSINLVAGQAVEAVRNKIDVSVFFTEDAPEEAMTSLKTEVENLPEVTSATYVSKEQALADFRSRHAGQEGIEEALTTLEGNPLSGHLIIKARTLEDFPKIIAFLGEDDRSRYIEDTAKDFEDSQRVISRLSGITDQTRRIGIIVSGVFVVISLLVVFNTIRITIYTHREEIGIMKLVGATNWFVRGPFLLESLAYAVLAAGISLAILLPVLTVATPVLSQYFADYGLNLSTYFTDRFWGILFWQFGLAIVLTMLSSVVAIRRYLRV